MIAVIVDAVMCWFTDPQAVVMGALTHIYSMNTNYVTCSLD